MTAATQTSPFHEGEHRIQKQLGVHEEIEPWARRVVRPFLPEEHREFYTQLPFLVLAARDRAGRPWAAHGPPMGSFLGSIWDHYGVIWR